jgi:hypothetical protein
MLEDTLRTIRRSINAYAWLHKAVEVINGLVIPVLIGLLATFQEKLIEHTPVYFWATLATLAVVALVLTALSLQVKSAPEVYLDWQRERDANANISKDIEYCTLLEAETLGMAGLVRGYIASRVNSRKALADAIDDVCGGFVEERISFFGFGNRELWNFAVYLWNPQTSRLEPVWRERARNHPSEGAGRSWADAEGHIGHAFRTRNELITGDSQDAAVAPFMAGMDNARPYDATAYRSFVSVPILATAPGALPLGVLVATSNKVSRYDPANIRILRHASVALATLIETAYDPP